MTTGAGSARRALLLGGTGFLGRNVLAALTGAGWETTVVSRRPKDSRTVVLTDHVPRRVQFAEVLAELRPSIVVNAAGELWRPDPDKQQAANVDLPEQLALALADSGCGARLVHIGTSMEYGPVPAPAATDEDSPTAPNSTYGRYKLAGTERVLAIAQTHAVDAVVLRVFNMIGPGMSASSLLGRTVTTLAQAWRERRQAVIELFDLKQYRDYVDVQDVAAAVVAAATMSTPGPRVPVFNIGSAVVRTAEDVARGLADVSGVDYRVTKVPPPTGDNSRWTARNWQLADTSRAAKFLGWSATRPLPETLRRIWLAECATTSPADVEAG